MRLRLSLLLTLLAALLLAGTGWHWFRDVEAAPNAPAEAASATPLANPAQASTQESCLGLIRDDPEAARAFAASWEGQGGGDAARHCAALALLAAGEFVRAGERLEGLAARSNAGPAARATLFGQAVQAWTMAGDANRAYAAATMALTLAPADPDLLLDRAIALAGQGRLAEALQDLDQAIAAAPDRAEAWVLRATALRRSDRVPEAERAIASALTLDPDSAEALLERGILRLERGDRSGANADWTRAVQLAPDSAAADLARQNLALNEAGPARR